MFGGAESMFDQASPGALHSYAKQWQRRLSDHMAEVRACMGPPDETNWEGDDLAVPIGCIAGLISEA